MDSIHYSWQSFHKISKKSFKQRHRSQSQNDLTIHGHNTEKKIVHLLTIHSITFEIPSIFLQQENSIFLLQREIVLLTILLYMFNREKFLLPFTYLIFMQKGKIVRLPKVTFGLPNPSLPNASLFLNVFYKSVTLLQN